MRITNVLSPARQDGATRLVETVSDRYRHVLGYPEFQQTPEFANNVSWFCARFESAGTRSNGSPAPVTSIHLRGSALSGPPTAATTWLPRAFGARPMTEWWERSVTWLLDPDRLRAIAAVLSALAALLWPLLLFAALLYFRGDLRRLVRRLRRGSSLGKNWSLSTRSIRCNRLSEPVPNRRQQALFRFQCRQVLWPSKANPSVSPKRFPLDPKVPGRTRWTRRLTKSSGSLHSHLLPG